MLFLREPAPESVETNGLYVAEMIERTKARLQTSRLTSAIAAMTIGSAMGLTDGFNSTRIFLTYYAAPVAVNALITVRSEILNRKNTSELEDLGPKIQEIQAEKTVLSDLLRKAGVNVDPLIIFENKELPQSDSP